jgi:hypothetical protein
VFRNIALTLATTAALGAAALAPSAASAHQFGFGGFHPGFHGGPHFGGWGGYHHRWPLGVGITTGLIGGAVIANSCYRRAVVATPYGPRVRWVNVCY